MAPPVDPFGVRAVLRTLPLGRRCSLAFGGSLLGLTIVSWCRTRPLFLGDRASLSGAVVPDAGDGVGVLRHARRCVGVSPACRALAWRNSPRPAGCLTGVAPKTQTTSAKNGEIGLFGVRRSAFWATLGYKLLAYTSATTWLECSQPNSHVVGSHVNPLCRTLTLECARKPLDTHVNRSTCVWAALPTRMSSG